MNTKLGILNAKRCCHLMLSVFPENVQQLFPKDDLLFEMEIEAYVGCPLFSSEGEKIIGLMVSLFKNKIDHVDTIIARFEFLGPRIEIG